MPEWILAADIGGTKVRGAVVSADGRMAARREFKTSSIQGPRDAVLRVADLLNKAREASGQRPLAACLAAPGLIDADRGVLLIAPNLPSFRDLRLSALVGEQLELPTYIENDASAAALGEFRFGAGRGFRHLLHATLGTGIGGGLVLDGRLYRGANGLAGEIGHIVIDPAGPQCNCGSRGCLESLVSGVAFAERARRLLRQRRSPILAEVVVGGEPTSRDLFEAASRGCLAAAAEIRNGGHLLGTAFGSLANVLNFEAITLSGGLLAMGEMLLEPARLGLRESGYGPAARVQMLTSSLGEDAGLLGATAVALERLDGGE